MSSSPRKRARSDKANDTKVPAVFSQVLTLNEYRIKDLGDAEVYYTPSFISEETADEWYTQLLGLDSCMSSFNPLDPDFGTLIGDFKIGYQPTLKMYGREMVQSRKIAAYATDPDLILKYSGQVVNMKYEYPPILREIQDQVEERLGVKFNHVMLNLYEDGKVYIGNHRDNIENKVIASVSLGSPRTFIMTRDTKVKLPSASANGVSTKAIPSDKSQSTSSSNKRKAGDDEEKKSSVAAGVNRKMWILASGSLVVMQGETQKYWKHEIPKEPKVKEGRISLTFRQLVK